MGLQNLARQDLRKMPESRGLALGETKTVVIEFLTPMLGTVPRDKEVYSTYIGSKAKTLKDAEEEVATVDEVEARGWTSFSKDENGLFIYSYLIKGFIKSAIETMQEAQVINKKIPAYKKWVDRMVFVNPRRIYFGAQEPDDVLERPLRIMTAKGERVTVARSDVMNAGRQLTFNISLLPNSKGLTWDALKSCLSYGEYVGLT